MIERTQKKLREAIFFLNRLENVTAIDPNDAAEFYLSALLSAARSVTFVLESEEPTTYTEWSSAWQASLTEAERQILRKFTNARNRALKREIPTVTEDLIERATRSSLPPELLFFFEMSVDDDAAAGPNRVLKGRLTPGGAEEEIIPACREYVALLSRLVTAFRESRQNGAVQS